MRKFKSYVTFSKEQRHGIFLLLILIVILQLVYFFVPFSKSNIEVNKAELSKFISEIDSLKKLELLKRSPKLYPFNPNYITDFKGAMLGMSNEEIDRLLAFRKQDKWIYSAEQFQDVTKVSDTLLKALSPYFKFPEWVTQSKIKNDKATHQNSRLKTYTQKKDLNTVTAFDLEEIKGVGYVLSNRIIKFRNTFKGGFNADIELTEVYGLTPEVILNITDQFTVKTPRLIKKKNLNTTTKDELVTIPHIDYDLAHNIIEQRQLRGGYKTINELVKVKGFPVKKIKIIELYLQIEKEN